MVHRFFIEYTLADLKKLLGINEEEVVVNEEKFNANYNIRTLEHMPVIVHNEGKGSTLKIEIQQFCLKNERHNNLLLNSRIEDVEMKFKPFIKEKSNRCILAIDGYYEWTEDKKKIFAIRPKKIQQRMFLAALKMSEEGNFVVFTQEAKCEIGKIHPRMPLFIKQEDIELYLNEDEFSVVRSTISKYNEDFIKSDLDIFRIGEHVNDQKDRSKNCLLTFDEFQKKQDSKGIKRFFSVVSKKKEEPQSAHSSKSTSSKQTEDDDEASLKEQTEKKIKKD